MSDVTSPRDLGAATDEARAARVATEAAVRMNTRFLETIRFALAMAGPLVAGIPGAPIAAEVVKIGLGIVEAEGPKQK